MVGANVPLFTSHFVFNAQTFNYTMVGTDPALGSATLKVIVRVIPIKFAFTGEGRFPPSISPAAIPRVRLCVRKSRLSSRR
jgi:hypothetical protein